MSKCFDCELCFYCGRFVTLRHEHDHFPVPRRAGGVTTVPACIDCHDLKDRFPLFSWPIHLLAPTFEGCKPELAMALLVAVGDSMPDEYRRRMPWDALSIPVRPLVEWSPDELSQE